MGTSLHQNDLMTLVVLPRVKLSQSTENTSHQSRHFGAISFPVIGQFYALRPRMKTFK